MGATVSRTSSTIDTGEKLLNQSDFNEMQSMTTNNIMNTVDNIKKSCAGSAQASQNAGINLTGATIGKGANFAVGNIDQRQTLNANLGCIQKSVTENTMANNISDAVQQHIANKFGANAQTQIANMAKAHSKAGFLPLLSASVSSANSNTKTRVNTKNIINTTLSNIVNNTIQQNYTDNDFETCIGNMILDQNSGVNAENLDLQGNVDIGNINQDQTLNFKQKCVQNSTSISKTLEGITNNFNTISEDAAEAGDKTAITAHTTAESKSGGLGGALTDLLNGVSKVVGQFKWVFIIIGIVVVVIIIAVVILISRGGSASDKLSGALSQRIIGKTAVSGTPTLGTSATSALETSGTPALGTSATSALGTSGTLQIPETDNRFASNDAKIGPETQVLTGGSRHDLANVIRQLRILANIK